MPKEFAFTWLEALTRGPIFKRIEERAVLQGEQNEFLEAEETLERDLATANENWAATRHVVQTNIQLYVECEDQIKHYSKLCSSIPTIELYTEYKNWLDRFKSIKKGYDVSHLAAHLASNASYVSYVQSQTELDTYKLPTNPFRAEYSSRLKAIEVNEKAAKTALTTAVVQRMDDVPINNWLVNVSKATRHLRPYAMQILRWMVHFNGSYAVREFCTLMGLADDHHHVRYAMYILEENRIISRTIHDNGEPIFGLCLSLRALVQSDTSPIRIVNQFLKAGRRIKSKRKVDLAETQKTNKSHRKRKSDDTTDDEDTEDDESSTNETDSETSIDESHNSNNNNEEADASINGDPSIVEV